MPPLPPAFLDRMTRLLGDEIEPFLASYRNPPDVGLRVNTLKLTPAEFRAISPFPLEPLPWTPDGFRVPEPNTRPFDMQPGVTRSGVITQGRPGMHPYHAAGLYYLQDPSAQAVAEILDPQPGERVLDLAAAPGGKTTHIAALMQDRGLLLANEIHPKRVWDLTKNLERWGTRNVIIANETPERLAAHLPGYFDRVLVDAPCSGEGMFRKTPGAAAGWSPEFIDGCALRQTAILDTAARLVRPGGWLAYATCTFAPEENERVITRFLEDHPGFELTPPGNWSPGFTPGRPGWGAGDLNRTSDLNRSPDLFRSSDQASLPPEKTVRLWPHRAPGEGHFIALLRRTGGNPERPPRPWPPSRSLHRLAPFWKSFARKTLTRPLDPQRLRVIKSYLYKIPPDAPDLSGIRIIRPGWWLGSFKKNRFEPAHALAMALRPEDARRTLPLDGDTTQAYLRRESLRHPGEDGWVLITLDGHPLGWGKRVRGVVKNHYPKGLRIT